MLVIDHVPSTVLMIRPYHFGYNSETAPTNSFQKNIHYSPVEIQKKALFEFDGFVKLLRDNGIIVEIFEDLHKHITPDSIFPNNWFSVHKEGLLIIYPMLSQSRRIEKRKDIVIQIQKRIPALEIIDLSDYENKNQFLEGTGSLVFDKINKIAYANLSSRTNKNLVKTVSGLLGYSPIIFSAFDFSGNEIYHTNVMMNICDGFSIICLDSISNRNEKKHVKGTLEKSGYAIIEISLEQMHSFCGNALQLNNSNGEKILVMSEKAYKGFSNEQRDSIERFCRIIYSPLETIETVGGGSARCMMAEL